MEETDKPMYYNAGYITFEKAKMIRNKITFHEKLLWEKLKNKQICGVRFRRQHPIDIFIADFYCHAARLVVELDGDIHNYKREYDDGRAAEIEKYLIKVLRVTNSEVEENISDVIRRIENEVKIRLKQEL